MAGPADTGSMNDSLSRCLRCNRKHLGRRLSALCSPSAPIGRLEVIEQRRVSRSSQPPRRGDEPETRNADSGRREGGEGDLSRDSDAAFGGGEDPRRRPRRSTCRHRPAPGPRRGSARARSSSPIPCTFSQRPPSSREGDISALLSDDILALRLQRVSLIMSIMINDASCHLAAGLGSGIDSPAIRNVPRGSGQEARRDLLRASMPGQLQRSKHG